MAEEGGGCHANLFSGGGASEPILMQGQGHSENTISLPVLFLQSLPILLDSSVSTFSFTEATTER